ncbi:MULTISPECIES: ParB/RepB/Spo0J family partition protein [unclassified Streptomyces]|uniref:ParB/RepB/Spo0J family partition protein n=1 Tax=unclassified Streptomyces TaxID=2593676 RepID=UPI0035D7FCC5
MPVAADSGDAIEVDVSDISANPFNGRDLGDVTHLAESIVRDGLIQEIGILHTKVFAEHFPKEAEGITTKYVLAYGERRWRAHLHLGAKTIQAVLRDDTAERIRRILFVENFHRKQLTPIEEARTFQHLVDEGMSYREIVKELHLRGPNHVSRRLDLLKLPEEIQNMVGTEGGPGVTVARAILANLSEPSDQTLAWVLMRTEGLSVKEAIRRIQEDDESAPEPNPAPESSVPTPRRQVEPEPEALPDSEEEQAEPESGTAKPDSTEPETQQATPQKASAKPSKPTATKIDKDTVERNRANADRDPACQALVSADQKLSEDQHDALYARTLLAIAPTQQSAARARAHRWLSDASRAEFSISNTESYFEAVLSLGKPELINRVTVATALAAGELRARDGRRQWDRTDAEHVRLLIEVTGYVPMTAWERGQLSKYDVPFPGAENDPDPEPID